MIIQALTEYYNRKAADPDSGIAKTGWERKEIKYIIVLDKSGAVVDLQNTQEGSGKDKRIGTFTVPQGVKRTVGVASNLLWDNAEYVLGMTLKEGKPSKDGRSPGEMKHDAFRERLESLGDVDDPGLTAVRRFVDLTLKEKSEQLQKKNPEQFENLEKDGAAVNLSFKLAGASGLIFESESVKRRISELATPDGSAPKGVCLITGQEEPIANLHPAIKGVQGGNTSGTNIVGFNLAAFCSFGKKQGENAPIGESTAFAYTTALNTLLAKDSTNKLLVGEATAVFWCEKQTAFEEQFVALFAVEPKDNPDQGVEAVKALYSSANAGTMTPQDEKEKDLRFYVLGLSPNAARLAIRFWINSTIDEMKRSIVQHFEDIKINRPAYIDRDFLPLFRLLVSVAVQGDAKNIPPNIEGDLMSAILEGKTYPRTLFNCAIERIRAERDITWPRAAILKAYLNRKLRLSKNANNNLDNTNNQTQPLTETEIQMSLDIENKNVGYCLGRLFATLEKIQDEANPGINATIRDRFYGAASGTPVTVFPNLIRLMTHHLSKLDNPGRVIYFEKLIGEILDKIDDFPATLSMEDQGRFALGYYHQNNDFYTKKTDSDNTQKTDSAKEVQSK